MAKYLAIMKLAPGVDNFRQVMEVFGKQGVNSGTTAIYAGTDGKTFCSIVDRDEPDLAGSATYAPFFESMKVIPIVDLDEAWVSAMQMALANLDQ